MSFSGLHGHLMWVLRAKYRSCARTASAPDEAALQPRNYCLKKSIAYRKLYKSLMHTTAFISIHANVTSSKDCVCVCACTYLCVYVCVSVSVCVHASLCQVCRRNTFCRPLYDYGCPLSCILTPRIGFLLCSAHVLFRPFLHPSLLKKAPTSPKHPALCFVLWVLVSGRRLGTRDKPWLCVRVYSSASLILCFCFCCFLPWCLFLEFQEFYFRFESHRSMTVHKGFFLYLGNTSELDAFHSLLYPWTPFSLSMQTHGGQEPCTPAIS